MDVVQTSLFGYSLQTLIALSLGAITLLMLLVCWVGWRLARPKVSKSIYSGLPLRKASEISYFSKVQVAKFFSQFSDYDNQLIKLYRASFCRETGRIFPNSVSWYGRIKVDWNFINRRHPGHYVSWGSLTEEQKQLIRDVHGSLEAFQTNFSSPYPSPRYIEPQYAFAKPGPLYVDLETKILVGWQCIPETYLEVLVVQKPLKSLALPLY